MAKILLIETATEQCSVAIAVGGTVVALEEASESLPHAALLTLQISRCAEAAGFPLSGLDAVAVSKGPGSYTSLRVGISVAKGICYALDKPLIAVDTLAALAEASKTSYGEQSGERAVLFLPMIDARRNEVWTSVYNPDMAQLTPPQPLILENNLFVDFINTALPFQQNAVLILSGNGMHKVPKVTIFENTVASEIKKCSALYLVPAAFRQFQNAEFQDIAYFEPLYMKPPNITVSNKSAWHEK